MRRFDKDADAVIQSIKFEMKNVVGDDRRRIDHPLGVLEYAETIRLAGGGSAIVVRAAPLLHDIGIYEAERKHGSAAGHYQETEGPPIARSILKGLGLSSEDADRICRIVGSHHSCGHSYTLEFRIIWDADWLTSIPDEHSDKPRDELADFTRRVLRTPRGKKLAEALGLN